MRIWLTSRSVSERVARTKGELGSFARFNLLAHEHLGEREILGVRHADAARLVRMTSKRNGVW